MADRASTCLPEEEQSAAQAWTSVMQGNLWDPKAAAVRREGRQRQIEGRRATGDNRTRKEHRARPPPNHTSNCCDDIHACWWLYLSRL